MVPSLCGFGIGGSWFTIGAWRLRDSVTGRPEVAGVRTNVLFDHRCNHVFHRCSQVAGPAARPSGSPTRRAKDAACVTAGARQVARLSFVHEITDFV